MRLNDKVALITGSGSGIGKETAFLFAKEGATVIVNDINKENGEHTAEKIAEQGGTVLFIQADITNELECKQMIETVIDVYGRIDVLFNNAGISGIGLLHETKLENWNRVMELNINGVFLVSKYVIPHMIEQHCGSIINMSSCIAEIGLADRASYAASKGAILALTKSMQVDYAEHNVRVNALMPGTIFTPFVEEYLSREADPESALKSIKERQLGKQLGKSIDVAFAALYLASDESKYMMGAPFMIDGGVVNGKRV